MKKKGKKRTANEDLTNPLLQVIVSFRICTAHSRAMEQPVDAENGIKQSRAIDISIFLRDVWRLFSLCVSRIRLTCLLLIQVRNKPRISSLHKFLGHAFCGPCGGKQLSVDNCRYNATDSSGDSLHYMGSGASVARFRNYGKF